MEDIKGMENIFDISNMILKEIYYSCNGSGDIFYQEVINFLTSTDKRYDKVFDDYKHFGLATDKNIYKKQMMLNLTTWYYVMQAYDYNKGIITEVEDILDINTLNPKIIIYLFNQKPIPKKIKLVLSSFMNFLDQTFIYIQDCLKIAATMPGFKQLLASNPAFILAYVNPTRNVTIEERTIQDVLDTYVYSLYNLQIEEVEPIDPEELDNDEMGGDLDDDPDMLDQVEAKSSDDNPVDQPIEDDPFYTEVQSDDSKMECVQQLFLSRLETLYNGDYFKIEQVISYIFSVIYQDSVLNSRENKLLLPYINFFIKNQDSIPELINRFYNDADFFMQVIELFEDAVNQLDEDSVEYDYDSFLTYPDGNVVKVLSKYNPYIKKRDKN